MGLEPSSPYSHLRGRVSVQSKPRVHGAQGSRVLVAARQDVRYTRPDQHLDLFGSVQTGRERVRLQWKAELLLKKGQTRV